MILILAHLEDLSAVRLHCALRSRVGPAGVKIVSVEEIALAPCWTHSLEASAARSSIRLADGTSIDDHDLELVVQRLRHVPVPHFAGAKHADRDYAATELHALLLSWLASLPCPVVDPPDAGALGVRAQGLLEWTIRASRAGLATRALTIATSARRLMHASRQARAPLGRAPLVELEPATATRRRVLVVGERAIGDVPAATAEACVRLARDAGCHLLEVELDDAASCWRFVAARAMVEIADAATATAVAAALLELHRREAA